jgi:hypothetical protein
MEWSPQVDTWLSCSASRMCSKLLGYPTSCLGDIGGVIRRPRMVLLEFYFAEVNLIDERELAVQTHQDVIDLISFLKNRTERRIHQFNLISSQPDPQSLGPSDTASSAAINLAIGIWLLVDPRYLDG